MDIMSIPLLADVTPLSILVFAFFEYIVIWGIVLGFAALLERGWRALRRANGSSG